jgi:hypothetical protein
MRFFTLILSLFLCVSILPACSSSRCCQEDALLPMETPKDPDDIHMRQAVAAFLQESGAPVSSVYDFKRIDLDGDKRRDALVLFKQPYGYWCGMHGCTMLVLRAQNEDFNLVSSIVPIREPLYVASTKTNGWRDIIAHVSGRWSETKDVAIQYNGSSYPVNPDNLPAYLRVASNDPVRIF